MPTFMTQPTFDVLTTARRHLTAKSFPTGVRPSYIFVPWAGEQLIAKSRGIYYVGIATDAEHSDGEGSFDGNVRGTEKFCRQPTRGYSPFWRFMDRLTRELLGGPYDRTQERWGWSNLMKVAGSKGAPGEWPAEFVDVQRKACIAALRQEITRLQESLIVVTSAHHYGILYEAIAQERLWDKQHRPGHTYWLHDPLAKNTYVHCYHPNYMSRKHYFEPAAQEVVQLARETLPPF
jgi:hypothetical protein